MTTLIISVASDFLTKVLGLPAVYLKEYPRYVLESLHVLPANFIILLGYLPNAILVVLYFLWRPLESPDFKNWWGWEYLRSHFFPITTSSSHPHPTKRREEERDPTKRREEERDPTKRREEERGPTKR
jgi:hypothetical protein